MMRLLSAGSNAHGQLGNGTLDDAQNFSFCSFSGERQGFLPPRSSVLDLATGANHTLVLLEVTSLDGARTKELWGCGDGRVGQLGYRYQQEIVAGRPSSTFHQLHLPLQDEGLEDYSIQKVCAGWETSYLILTHPNPDKGDVLLSFGGDEYRDLGVGVKAKGKGVAKELNRVTFDHLTVDGTTIPAETLHIKSITASQHHVIAHIRSENWGIIVGWGASRHGQIGSTSTGNQKPVPVIDRPRVVFVEPSTDPPASISVGSQHSVFLFSSGLVTGIGSNRKNQLRGVETLSHCTAVGCTWNGTFAISTSEDESFALYATGSNTHGQLGRGKPPDLGANPSSGPGIDIVSFPKLPRHSVPISLACGTEHVLTLWESRTQGAEGEKVTTEVWGWGWNEHGNLGYGTVEDAHEPVRIWPRTSEDGVVVGIWAGSGTSWICTTQE